MATVRRGHGQSHDGYGLDVAAGKPGVNVI
jgi:hypothetical protein